MSKLVGISRSKYRVAISDVLPYERPVFFTNRFFTRFLKYYGIVCRDGRLIATKNLTDGLGQMLGILGGSRGARRPAFQYTIAKNSIEKGRKLTVIHPYHQVQMIEFYDHYKTVITDFCQRSHYSIRYPYKVAVVQKRSKGYPQYLSDEKEFIHPEESVKHFFAYKHYHNINEFYDDYRFLRAEKRFSMMEKTDLEHCFDSIKPETLSQAMFGCAMEDAQGTMPYEFWQLNQSFENKPDEGIPGEGIVIGPEFSRIYAEIIMQQVDANCEAILERKGILLNRDYVFYRYVDDGFLFCNTLQVKDLFNTTYGSLLGQYGLKRGKKKMHFYNQRPFLENLTAGKLELKKLIEEKFQNRLETFIGFKKVQQELYDTPTFLDYKSFVQSVRSIICTYRFEYKAVMSYVLGVISNHLASLLRDFNNLYKQYSQAEYYGEISNYGKDIKDKYERDFVDFLENLVEVLFYFYSCDPRMSTSTKIVSIINQLQLFVRGKYQFEYGDWSIRFRNSVIDTLDAAITEQTQSLFAEISRSTVSLIEVLNFLELQKCMSVALQIHPRRLNDMLIGKEDLLNFFTVSQLMHFFKNDERYADLKSKLIDWIERKVSLLYEQTNISDTEAVLTFFEFLCCPWVEAKQKERIIDGFNRFDQQEKMSILSCATKQRDLFVKWRDYSILEEMQHINNTEVY